MVDTRILESQIDKSVNFISPVRDGGYFESRVVQRTDDTLIIYLSSMSGCDLSCRFCHLTQTGQTMSKSASPDDILEQADTLLQWMKNHRGFEGITTVHFNFMARGDILANQYFRTTHSQLFYKLSDLVGDYCQHASVKFKISTIFPYNTEVDHEYGVDLYDIKTLVNWVLHQADHHKQDVEFYYSLYSLRPSFRKRWIPKAIDPEWIGTTFSGRDSGLRLHHAMIAGQNDTEEDVALIHDWLERHDLKVKLNIVRYNPYDTSSGSESSDEAIQTYLNQMKLSHRITDTQVVSRVGIDVHASCGTFFK